MSDNNKKFNTKCPECKADAIALFNLVQCITASCKNYNPKLLAEEPVHQEYYEECYDQYSTDPTSDNSGGYEDGYDSYSECIYDY